MQISPTTRLYDSLTSRFIYPFRVYRLTTKFLGTFRGQWSNLVCGQQTGVVRMKSRCNKCIYVVHLVTRARGGGGGKDREGGTKKKGDEKPGFRGTKPWSKCYVK